MRLTSVTSKAWQACHHQQTLYLAPEMPRQVVSPSEEHGPSTHALALQHASASLLLGPSGEVLPSSRHSLPTPGYPTFKFGPSEESSRRRSRGSPPDSPRGHEGSLSPIRRSSQVPPACQAASVLGAAA